MYKEFEKTIGCKLDNEDVKKIIKAREKEGYVPMKPYEAERFWAERKKQAELEKKQKEDRLWNEILNKQGFV